MKRFLTFLTVASIAVQPLALNVPLAKAEENTVYRQYLIQTIATLTAQLEALMSSMTISTADSVRTLKLSPLSLSRDTFDSNLYSGDYESIYSIGGRHTGPPSSNSDERMWQLFVDTIGVSATKEYVGEFRTYDDKYSEFDAFVETDSSLGNSAEWVLAVNTATLDIHDEDETESTQELFIHEYAHLLIHNMPDAEESFIDSFWTSNDLNHSKEVAGASSRKASRLAEEYYDEKPNAFVSSYATISPEEDFAESFMHFVTEKRPRGDRKYEKKMLFFYDYSELVEIRSDIRSRINF